MIFEELFYVFKNYKKLNVDISMIHVLQYNYLYKERGTKE
ncbi:hypothetical protein CLL_A1075 [Clostridium botulinum B str. Eklund 17B (NRP)]|uniref:Uncharacterized protein n=1 Tax=Clostridium botulinum (strain Eklund 17B / Type B) TaxID=935198 RepID=B2TN44_CLOBB|nr:hypothetical protein CLL_A1075 [Clostridium botulinum B str. Eklund 17B (NRP)]